MNEAMLIDILVFSGLMALLATVGKLAFALVNRRRGGLPAVDAKLLDEINARLAHLEQVADSSAVEIERIGEGQRFTTKVLSERSQVR